MQAIAAVRVLDRDSEWRQDQPRNVLRWKQRVIGGRLRRAADLGRPIAASISFVFAAIALSRRSTRGDRALMRQRHHHDEHQYRGDGSEALHSTSISRRRIGMSPPQPGQQTTPALDAVCEIPSSADTPPPVRTPSHRHTAAPGM